MGNNASFVFLPHSPLKPYTWNNNYHWRVWSEFSIGEILYIIHCDVEENKMYDPTNPDILILTGDLKAALRTTYLHRSELYSLMMEQMAISMARRPVPNEEAARFIQRPEAITSNIIRNLEEAAMRVDFFVMREKPIFNFVIHVKSYSTSNFCITSALRRLIRTLAGYYEKYSYTCLLYTSPSPRDRG